MIGLKHKTHATVQIKRELPLAITRQWMRLACDQLAHVGSRLQICQPTAQLAGARCAQCFDGVTFLFTKRTEIIIGNIYFQPDFPYCLPDW